MSADDVTELLRAAGDTPTFALPSP
jgi:hypothetical protein